MRYSNKMAKGHFKVTAINEESKEEKVIVDQQNLFTDLCETTLDSMDGLLGKNNIANKAEPLGWAPGAIMLINDPSNGGLGTETAALSDRYIGDTVGYFDISVDNGNGSHPVKGNRILQDYYRTQNVDGSFTDKFVGEFYTPTANSAPINKLAVAALPLTRYRKSDYTDYPGGGLTNNWGGLDEDSLFDGFSPYSWKYGYRLTGRANAAGAGMELINPNLDFVGLYNYVFSGRQDMSIHRMLTAAGGAYHVMLNHTTGSNWNSGADLNLEITVLKNTGYYTSRNIDITGAIVDKVNPDTFSIVAAQTSTFGFLNTGSVMRSCIDGASGDLYVVHMSEQSPNTIDINIWRRSENYATQHLEQVAVDFTYTSVYGGDDGSGYFRSGLMCSVKDGVLVVGLVSQIMAATESGDPNYSTDFVVTIRIDATTWLKEDEVELTSDYALSNYRGYRPYLTNMYYDFSLNLWYFFAIGYGSNSANIYNEAKPYYGHTCIRVNPGANTVGLCHHTAWDASFSGYDVLTGKHASGWGDLSYSFLGTNSGTYTKPQLCGLDEGLGDITGRDGGSYALSANHYANGARAAVVTTLDLLPNQEWGCITTMMIDGTLDTSGMVTHIPVYRSPTQPILAETLITPFQKDNSTTLRIEYELTVYPVTTTPAP